MRCSLKILTSCIHSINSRLLFYQNVKNEAEAYMLKELSLLMWQEKASKLAFAANDAQTVKLQSNISNMEENLKAERSFFHIILFFWMKISIVIVIKYCSCWTAYAYFHITKTNIVAVFLHMHSFFIFLITSVTKTNQGEDSRGYQVTEGTRG